MSADGNGKYVFIKTNISIVTGQKERGREKEQVNTCQLHETNGYNFIAYCNECIKKKLLKKLRFTKIEPLHECTENFYLELC